MNKRPRRKLTITDLPADIQDEIISYLTRTDLKQLSLLNKRLRQQLLPHVFRKVHGTWETFTNTDPQAPHMSKYRRLVKEIHLETADSFNEYQSNSLGGLFTAEHFEFASTVTINSSSLSYWLKYNTCPTIRLLHLYGDDPREKVFHISHIHAFTGLESLDLHGYHFNWSVEDVPGTGNVPKIRSLTLEDCTWDYPFNLGSFNLDDNLRTFRVKYTNSHSFVLSERFLDFLREPFPAHQTSLRDVSVEFRGFSKNKKLLTHSTLHGFLSCFINLERLQFSGWTANLAHIKRSLYEWKFTNPLVLILELEILDSPDPKTLPIPNLKLLIK